MIRVGGGDRRDLGRGNALEERGWSLYSIYLIF